MYHGCALQLNLVPCSRTENCYTLCLGIRLSGLECINDLEGVCEEVLRIVGC